MVKVRLSFWKRLLVGFKAFLVGLVVAVIAGIANIILVPLALLGAFGMMLVVIIGLGLIVFNLWLFGTLANKWWSWR
jgi:Mg/Co/Ni transporter MgtE